MTEDTGERSEVGPRRGEQRTLQLCRQIDDGTVLVINVPLLTTRSQHSRAGPEQETDR